MSSDNNQSTPDYSAGDSKADAIAAVAVLSIIIVTVVYWLTTLG
jgi:diacylglycerol kinase